MKNAAFLLLFCTAACSSIPDDEIKNSVIGSYFQDPVISINPEPSGYIHSFDLAPVFHISNPGGIGAVLVGINGINKEYDAAKASNYTISSHISVTKSGSVPVSVTAYSSRTGGSTVRKFSYLFDLSTVSDPPTILINDPTNNALVPTGSIRIQGQAFHGSAKVSKLVIRRAGEADRVYSPPEPYPNSIAFDELYTVSSPGSFGFSVEAASGALVAVTNNYQYTVMDSPILDSLTPPLGSIISTLQTNFNISIRTPHPNTSVSLYWDGRLVGTKTADGSGAPLAFAVNIAHLASPPYTGSFPLRIEASYPGSSVLSISYTYDVNHTGISTPPVITGITPDPKVAITYSSPINLQGSVSQLNAGLKEIHVQRLTVPTAEFSNTFPASPPTYSYNFSHNFNTGGYAGDHNFRIQAISQVDVTNTELLTYTIPAAVITIDPPVSGKLTGARQSFQIDISDTVILSNVIVSTNTTAGPWNPVAVYGPLSTAASNFVLSLPLPSGAGGAFKIRVASLNSSGIITTNEFSYTVTHTGPYFVSVNPPSGSTVPNTDVPLDLRLESPANMVSFSLQGPSGNIAYDLGFVSPFYNYKGTLNGGYMAAGSTVDFNAYVNGLLPASGTLVTGSPITYTVVAAGTRVFASFPQENMVVPFAIATIQVSFTNWGGSSTLPSGGSSITKTSGVSGLGSSYTIPMAVNKGAFYNMPPANAFLLDVGENKFRIQLTGSGGVTPLSKEISIYRQGPVSY